MFGLSEEQTLFAVVYLLIGASIGINTFNEPDKVWIKFVWFLCVALLWLPFAVFALLCALWYGDI